MIQWQHYLHNGLTHIICTDNQAVSYFLNKKDLSRKQMAWQSDLSKFDFQLQFRRGKDNEVADALSRLPTSAPTRVEVKPDKKFLDQVRTLYKDNDDYALIWSELKEGRQVDYYKLEDRLLFYRSKLCIPKDYIIWTDLLEEAHAKEAGHLSADRTLELLE